MVETLLDEATRREHKQRNVVHSLLLLAGIGAILALAAWLLSGWIGVIVSFGFVLVIFLGASRVPPEVVMRMYRAQPVAASGSGQFGPILVELARRAELERVPRLYVIPSMTLNAFATGTRDNAAIALTEGLLRRLSVREVIGVLAHEMSHVRNNDLWVMGVADVMSRFTQTLYYSALLLLMLNLMGLAFGEQAVSWWAIVILFFAPAISSLLQLGLSRAREYDADLEAAMLTGDPIGLASALRRLENYTGRFWEDMLPPVPGRKVPAPSVLRSHPATEDRIERLLALQARPQQPQIVVVEEPMVSLVGWGPFEMRPRYRFPGLWF